MGDATGYEARLHADALESRHQLIVSHANTDTVHYACEIGSIPRLNAFIEEGMKKGYPDSVSMMEREPVLGMMPLHVAAEHGNVEIVQFLLSKRVDVDAGDNQGVKPLHLAAICNHIEVAKVLFAAGASPNLEDKTGDTPLHWAATKGHIEMMELLMLKRAKVDFVNKVGWTPLLRAAYNGRDEACSLLVRNGASLLSRTPKEGNTALHLACLMNHISSIQTILSLGAPMDLVNNDGKTCYEVCFTEGGREICESFGYSYVTKEDRAAKREREQMEAAKRAEAEQVELKMKKLEMMRSTNSMNRREHAKPTDDFPEDSFLQEIKPAASRAPRSFYADDEDNDDDEGGSGLLKPSAFLKEVAHEGGATNPYAQAEFPGPSKRWENQRRQHPHLGSTVGSPPPLTALPPENGELGGAGRVVDVGEEGGELIGRGGGREGGVGTSGNVLESSIGLLGGNGAVGLPPRPSSRSVSSRPLMGGPLPLPPIGLGASSSSFTSQGRGGDGGGSSNISRSSSGRHGGENGSRGGSRGEGGGIGPLFEEAKAMSPRRDRVEVVGRTARPQSANQKFLKKYNLAQYNLFSPS